MNVNACNASSDFVNERLLTCARTKPEDSLATAT